jgi:exosome complex component RRP42
MIDRSYVLKKVSEKLRTDGRKPDEFRKVFIQPNPLSKPEGSAIVKTGRTEVVAGIKMDVCQPFPDSPDKGVLMASAEFPPLASAEFELGPPDEDAIELARVIDRGIRESGAIDMDKLCIEKGEKVWRVSLDIHIINRDGNLFTASSLAAIVALHNTKIPYYDGEAIDYGKPGKKLPVKFKPVAITFAKIGEWIIVDPNFEEEETMDGGLVVTVKDDNRICSLQKLGSCGFTVKEIDDCIQNAIKKAKELRALMTKPAKILELPKI